MKSPRKIRYAVVGLGHIAQVAVLPAFAHARKNSQLAALVSDDPEKLKTSRRRYKVDHVFSYDEYNDCLRSGCVDAVYIALPNHLHAKFTFARGTRRDSCAVRKADGRYRERMPVDDSGGGKSALS